MYWAQGEKRHFLIQQTHWQPPFMSLPSPLPPPPSTHLSLSTPTHPASFLPSLAPSQCFTYEFIHKAQ